MVAMSSTPLSRKPILRPPAKIEGKIPIHSFIHSLIHSDQRGDLVFLLPRHYRRGRIPQTLKKHMAKKVWSCKLIVAYVSALGMFAQPPPLKTNTAE